MIIYGDSATDRPKGAVRVSSVPRFTPYSVLSSSNPIILMPTTEQARESTFITLCGGLGQMWDTSSQVG